MRHIVNLLFFFMIGYCNAQGITQSIKEKVWKLQESYLDSVPVQDTLYVLFSNDSKLISSTTPFNVRFSLNARSTLITGTYKYQPANSFNPGKLIIKDSEELIVYEILYYDSNNLVLESKHSISGKNLVNETDYDYTMEWRFIWDH